MQRDPVSLDSLLIGRYTPDNPRYNPIFAKIPEKGATCGRYKFIGQVLKGQNEEEMKFERSKRPIIGYIQYLVVQNCTFFRTK